MNRLQIHLEGEQTVYFDPSNKDQSIERIEKSERTKLIAFFRLNKLDKAAKKLLYRDLPEHYTWDSTKKDLEQVTTKR